MANNWHQSWRDGRIAFHKGDVHSDLIGYQERFLAGGPHRVLVPLCGKTVDLCWMAELGHQVVGIELVPQAVEEFFDEQGLVPEVREAGSLRFLRAGNITILNGDLFAVCASDVGAIDRIWDRAALVALPADVRERYVQHLRSLASPHALLLQNLFEYDQSKMAGPPFSVPDDEFRRHYAGASIELLSEEDTIESAPQFRARGHEYWWVRNYLVTL